MKTFLVQVTHKLPVISLFAGCGALELGLSKCGTELAGLQAPGARVYVYQELLFILEIERGLRQLV